MHRRDRPPVRPHAWALAGVLCCSLVANAVADEEPADAVLRLTNGGYVPGKLEGSDRASVLRWRSPLFARPFEFPLSAVGVVHYPQPEKRPQPTGEYCFELAGDDVLYGDLVGLSADEVTVRSARVGRIHLRWGHVRRFYRWQERDLIYLGPTGLSGWTETAAARQWRDEGGLPVTDQPGASLYGDFRIPPQALIEFELSWQQRPGFVLALGVDEQSGAVRQAFRFEVWDDDLVVLGESKRDADLASVQKIGKGPGRVRLQAYLDQPRQRLLLFSRNGRSLASLRLRAKSPPVHTGLRLTNKDGDVRLENLRISRWNGMPPRQVQADKSRIHRSDSSIVYGRLAAYDADAKQFTIRDGETETTVKAAQITDVFLSPSTSGEGEFSADPAEIPFQRTLRLEYRDGSRFSGEPTRIETTHVSLECPGVKEPLRLPLAALRSLVSTQRRDRQPASSAAGRAGRLELDGVRLPGRLVDGRNTPEASCLVWHPDLARSAAPLRHGLAGRIVYRDPPPPKPVVKRPVRRARGFVRQRVGIGGIVGSTVKRPARKKPSAARRPSLHLRSGDTIPCEVTAIDERGVTFNSSDSDATFVPHEKIKAVELTAGGGLPALEKIKRERLLTLPRLLKNSPPTHLICSKRGDVLRARLLSMDEERLQVEVRLETTELPRDRIAQIIWLHDDELSGEEPPPAIPAADAAASPPGALRVQALRSDGNRLTFVAEKLEGNSLSGTSEILGACRVDFTQIDQLLFGSFIEQAAARLAYHRWKLHHAVEPKFVQADGESVASRPNGTASPLVGQPAPDFKLDLLDGGRFRLADRKGKIVVLDFWATWCGPCLQTMPLVERVAGEFADDGVELIAVNMEEQPQQIKSMLQRHKLEMPVALDRDGVAAARYSVTAIPQTVVIDREGNVARLFVGGGLKLEEPLREALQQLLK